MKISMCYSTTTKLNFSDYSKEYTTLTVFMPAHSLQKTAQQKTSEKPSVCAVTILFPFNYKKVKYFLNNISSLVYSL